MGKSMASQFSDDDYFAEPNYDDLTDDELDELYYSGEVRSMFKKKRAARKAPIKKVRPELFADGDDELWLEVDEDSEPFDVW